MRLASAIALFLSGLGLCTACSSETPSETTTDASLAPSGHTARQLESVKTALTKINRTDVDIPNVVRVVKTSEQFPLIAMCLQEAGWNNVQIGEDGSLNTGMIPEGQFDDYELQSVICSAKYPVSDEVFAPLTEQELQAIYAHQTGPLTVCLQEKGYVVPDAPSFQKWRRDYTSGSPTMWDPFAGTHETSPDEFNQLKKECDTLELRPDL